MYLKYDRKIITDFSNVNVEEMYNNGYVFGRIEPGQMDQTRSLRINLKNFELTSENRRIVRKTKNLILEKINLPVNLENYNWKIHKTGKDFYTTKFGDKTFSANKIKELITTKHNFNSLLQYTRDSELVGYCISLDTSSITHYCYPFYNLDTDTRNLGMGMMLKAILRAVELDKNFIYLGSVQRDSDKYKIQFKGLEIWNQENSCWDEINI